MVPHDRFTDLRRPPSAIARSSTIEHDIMRRVREWMAGGPPPHGLPSLRQPPTARAVEDCLDETAVLMDLVDVVYNMRLAAANQMITKSKQLPKRLAESH